VDTEQGSHVRLALLASPLLGPAVWAAVAERLTDRGWDVLVPPPTGEVAGPGDVLDRWLSALPRDVPLVLVPHSNAGLYAAALADALDVRGIVFVDAGLPSHGPVTQTAPAELRAFLAGLVEDDGQLPVWTQWWPPEDVDGLFPDPDTRSAVEAEQARLPLAYFDAAVPSPAGWQALPAAYLAFGDTYAAERSAAGRRGWPATTLAGDHLHPLTDPAGVCASLEGLLGRMGFPRPKGGPIRV
jgi:hypothetical protein